jgi:hypothetical protein
MCWGGIMSKETKLVGLKGLIGKLIKLNCYNYNYVGILKGFDEWDLVLDTGTETLISLNSIRNFK